MAEEAEAGAAGGDGKRRLFGFVALGTTVDSGGRDGRRTISGFEHSGCAGDWMRSEGRFYYISGRLILTARVNRKWTTMKSFMDLSPEIDCNSGNYADFFVSISRKAIDRKSVV